MNDRTKMGKCAYCGEEKKVTRDHVISSCLFPQKNVKKNVIVTPGRTLCNRGFSLDEEYFRIFITGLALEYSRHASELFFTKVKRSVIRRPQIGSKVKSRMKLVDLFTKGGIYLGKRTRIDVPDEDWERYYNVLGKYIKGLFYYEFKAIFPAGHKIEHSFGNEDLFPRLNQKMYKWNLDNKEIFVYGFSYVPDTYNSIWVTIFYDSVFFVSFVGTNQDFEYIKQRVDNPV